MTLRALYVDFDSYFASVEQQEQPELRGRPVAVVPVMTDSTCCIAASYEAKAFGIKTGTGVGEARRLCPELHCVHARHEVYVRYHHQLVEIVESQIPVEAVRSIDEMWSALTGSWQTRARAEQVAHAIKASIAEQVGEYVRCSIGIGPNRFIAKLASAMNKPDGLKTIEKHALPAALQSLDLRDITGVGRRMERRLRDYGLTTVADLCAADIHVMRKIWNGVEGERMYGRLRGEEVYEPPTERGSVGHSHVLPPERRNEKEALRILHRMLQKAALRLRKLGYHAGGMQLVVRQKGQATWSRQTQFSATQDTVEFEHALIALWAQRPSLQPVGVGVSLTRLVINEQATLSLFAPLQSRNRDRLTDVVDEVNSRFGKSAAYFGAAHGALDEAPMRIAFTSIPDPDIEQ